MRENKFKFYYKNQLLDTLSLKEISDRNYHWADNVQVVEYTGLKDSTKWEQLIEEEQKAWLSQGKTKEEWNGKEIYGGDIVRTKYGAKGAQELVVRELNKYGLVFDRIGIGGIYFYSNLPQQETMEVVGNIYENPEFLEVE